MCPRQVQHFFDWFTEHQREKISNAEDAENAEDTENSNEVCLVVTGDSGRRLKAENRYVKQPEDN